MSGTLVNSYNHVLRIASHDSERRFQVCVYVKLFGDPKVFLKDAEFVDAVK